MYISCFAIIVTFQQGKSIDKIGRVCCHPAVFALLVCIASLQVWARVMLPVGKFLNTNEPRVSNFPRISNKESETKTRESETKIRESETKISRIRNQKPRESETKIQESDTNPRESETENQKLKIANQTPRSANQKPNKPTNQKPKKTNLKPNLPPPLKQMCSVETNSRVEVYVVLEEPAPFFSQCVCK